MLMIILSSRVRENSSDGNVNYNYNNNKHCEKVFLVSTNTNIYHTLYIEFSHWSYEVVLNCTEETQLHTISLCSHRQTDSRAWIPLDLSRRHILFIGDFTNSLNVQTLWPRNSRISLKEVIKALIKICMQKSVTLI